MARWVWAEAEGREGPGEGGKTGPFGPQGLPLSFLLFFFLFLISFMFCFSKAIFQENFEDK